MKLKIESVEYAVYCWDGWQRGHMGDFKSRISAVQTARKEARSGIFGDIYYVEQMPGRMVIADFEAGCV